MCEAMEPKDFDQLLALVGEYGKYQKRLLYLFIYPMGMILPFFIMIFFFQVAVPSHWCHVEGRERLGFSIEQWKNLTIPERMTEEGVMGYSKCEAYDVSWIVNDVLNNTSDSDQEDLSAKAREEFQRKLLSHPPGILNCDRWEFDRSVYVETVVSQFSWVCKRDHFPAGLLTIQSAGHILGSFIFGPVSDYFGRRVTFFATTTIQWIFGLALIFSPDFPSFATLTFVGSWVFPAAYQNAYVLVVEQVGPDYRGLVNGAVNCIWTVGLCLLALIAWLLKGHWIHLALIGNVPVLLYYGYYWLLKESPRWQLTRSKVSEVRDTMIYVGKVNGKEIDPDEMERLIKIVKDREQDPIIPQYWSLLKRPVMRTRTIVTTYTYMAVLALYYGLHLDVGTLGRDPYLSTAILAAIELPSYLISYFCMERYGRRWVCSALLLIAAIGTGLVPAFSFGSWCRILWAVVGKFGASGGFLVVYQQEIEVFPTVLRNTGLAFVSIVSTTICIGVPYLIYLGTYHVSIPYVTFAFVAGVGAVLSTFLPETLHKDLPETLHDAETFATDQKYWSLNLHPSKSTSI
ncbi:unnamed protein product [Darwinula stevensoni]|uniref:Major facilitator superfamily (MFS) profile domain-containing protein n=1 Tax=Darwinula stevensoni TaxID=69355 RepID=A0A7R8X263_9CRUS|nr:unnamed protein product [Darwinula stevensoni]CAG0883611.1 unnamed protein product [Darwinula stevensoni]